MADMINLLQGDCLELMKDIPDKSIDMILCDPPLLGQPDANGIQLFLLSHYGKTTQGLLKIMVLFVYFLKCHLPHHQ